REAPPVQEPVVDDVERLESPAGAAAGGSSRHVDPPGGESYPRNARLSHRTAATPPSFPPGLQRTVRLSRRSPPASQTGREMSHIGCKPSQKSASRGCWTSPASP